MQTKTTWKTGHVFESAYNDARIEIGSPTAYSPKALLLGGLAGCTGIDVVDLLEKMRVPFAGLTIEVTADTTEEHPKVFKDIHINYSVQTDEENRAKVQKAIDLSLDKYCGVSAMLRKNSRIDYSITIQPDPI